MNRSLKAQQEAEATMFLAAIMGYGMAGLRKGPPILTEREKKSRKCLLPSCAALTTHNGGYCCAEHCKQHRADTSNPSHQGTTHLVRRTLDGVVGGQNSEEK